METVREFTYFDDRVSAGVTAMKDRKTHDESNAWSTLDVYTGFE